MAAPLAYSQTQTTSTSLPTTTGEYYKNLGVKKEEPTFETLLGKCAPIIEDAATVLPCKLRHVPASNDQHRCGPSPPAKEFSVVSRFIQTDIASRPRFHLYAPAVDPRWSLHLSSNREILDNILAKLTSWPLRWLAPYGCVMLGISTEDDPRVVNLAVLGLDKWQHSVHSAFVEGPDKTAVTKHQHFSFCNDHSFVSCGQIKTVEKDAFLAEFDTLLENKANKKGDTRTGTQRHKKTPEFVASVIEDSIILLNTPVSQRTPEDVCHAVPPKGGFTDVDRRDGTYSTNWPIVSETVRFILKNYENGYLLHVIFTIELLSWIVDMLTSKDISQLLPHFIDTAQTLNQELVGIGINVYDMGYSVIDLMGFCKEVKGKVKQIAKGLAFSTASSFNLVDNRLLAEVPNKPLSHMQDFNVSPVVPVATTPAATRDPELVIRTIKCTEMRSPSEDLCSYYHRVQSTYPCPLMIPCDVCLQLLRVFEVTFRSWTSYLNNSSGTRISENLEMILASYRDILLYFFTNHDAAARSIGIVVLQSKETLYTWLITCVTHCFVVLDYPAVSKYGLPVKYQSLQYLVLPDKEDIKCLSLVAAYLHRYDKRDLDTIFLPGNLNATRELACDIVTTDPKLETWRDSVLKNDAEEIKRHWNTVQNKKAQLKDLREQLTQELNRVTWQYRYSRLVSMIHEAEEPPPPVILTFPDSYPSQRLSDANFITFFVIGPAAIHQLGTLLFTSQKLLVPRNFKFKDENITTTWKSHVQRAYQISTEFDVKLAWEKPTKIPCRCGPSSIEYYNSERDGVWSPEDCGFKLYWEGKYKSDCHSTYFNPCYYVPFPDDTLKAQFYEASRRFFTCELPPVNKATNPLQWCMTFDMNDLARGNSGLACQNKCPPWLSKRGYHSFSTLRAGQHQQLRKICQILHDNSLPLFHREVLLLMQQALHQVGSLSVLDNCTTLNWRQDQAQFFSVLAEELHNTLDRIQNLAREHESMLLLTEFIAFLCSWEPNQVILARKCASICRKWAEECKQQLQSLGSSDAPLKDSHELRGKECLFTAYSLLCYAGISPSLEEVKEIVRSLVLIHNGSVFIEESRSISSELEYAKVQCLRVMSVLFNSISLQVNDDILTSAAKSVLQFLPSDLKWVRRENTSTWYAVSTSPQNVFSVNLLTGLVLVDALPLRTLPDDITNHELYKRTFGDRMLEVTKRGCEWWTVSKLSGCLYKFSKNERNLIITEFCNENEQLQLLDTIKVPEWLSVLPKQLQELYSLWFSGQHNTILCRGKKFNDRKPRYIISLPPCCRIFVVPSYADSWNNLDCLEFLVAPVSEEVMSILHCLSKFEMPEFIHIHVALCKEPPSVIKFVLPRFQLEFELTAAGTLKALDMQNYFLDPAQQFDNMFTTFQQYLILKPLGQGNTKFLLQEGKVIRMLHSGKVKIISPLASDAKLTAISVELHPRLSTFRTDSISVRLQLAAVFAASGSLLPDTYTRMTGGEMATDLIRKSFPSRSLSQVDLKKVYNVQDFCAGTPILAVVCAMLIRESNNLDFDSERIKLQLVNDDDCKTEYSRFQQRPYGCCYREQVTCFERFLPVSYRHNSTPAKNQGSYQLILPPKFAATLKDIKQQLLNYSKQEMPHGSQEFPFECFLQGDIDTLGKELQDELRESWKQHQTQPLKVSSTSLEFQQVLHKVRKTKQKLYKFLRQALEKQYLNSTSETNYFFKRITNVLSTPTTEDFLVMSWSNELLNFLLPLFSAESRTRFRTGIFTLLQLFVLEDKLERLKYFQDSEQKERLENELANNRVYDVEAHPKWLAFEVERQLEIREDQLVVTEFLIKNPGSIVQLNMGLGKTRVIVPLLILHFSDGSQLARVSLLSPLLSEGVQFLHSTLTASCFRAPLLELPFHRRMNLSEYHLDNILRAIDRCNKFKGAVVVAPEHRLSIILKQQEVRNVKCASLLKEIISAPYKDIIDEADAILHPRYELVYTVGSPHHLSSGSVRWTTIESLLWILHHPGEPLKNALHQSQVSVIDKAPPHFSLRLLPGPSLEECKGKIVQEIANQLISDPPYEFRWLKQITEKLQKKIISVICDSNCSVHVVDFPMLSPCQFEQLLALHGMLAMNVLFCALEKRHRVNYGIDHSRNPPKQIAVPFRASDTPDLQAEFSHPDSAIAFTCLSYYHDGLSADNILEATQVLLKLPLSCAEAIYSQWLYTSDFPEIAEKASIQSVDRLDLTSKVQFSVLVKAFSFSIGAINFWLSNCVFPKIPEFSEQIKLTAWHLASEQAIGFSGTNDVHWLMPSTMKHKTCDPSLSATNGEMLDLLSKHATVFILPHTENVIKKEPVYNSLLNYAVESGCEALIDTGALLAGIRNNVAAEFLCRKLDARKFKGVVYFDQQWYVLERNGRNLPHFRSPVHEMDAFVIFDEAHSRGADMKLKPEAKGILTVGPLICKEKLMQGAGRLRALHSGQRVILVVPEEVRDGMIASGIKCSSSPSVQDVLQYVIQNTVKTNRELLPQWALKGAHYIHSQFVGRAPLIPVKRSLSDLYSECISKTALADQFAAYFSVNQMQLDASSQMIKQQISQACIQYGGHFKVELDSECEQELENEVEAEKEVETQISEQTANKETPWDFKTIISACSPKDLPPKVYELSSIFRERISDCSNFSSLAAVESVYVTENFLFTVKFSTWSPQPLDQYLSFVDAVVIFAPTSESQQPTLLLLSLLEAESVLQIFWQGRREKRVCPPKVFINWEYLRFTNDIKSSPLAISMGDFTTCALPESYFALLHIFNGEVKIQSEKRQQGLLSLFKSDPEKALLSMLLKRGNAHNYERSDLQQAVDYWRTMVCLSSC